MPKPQKRLWLIGSEEMPENASCTAVKEISLRGEGGRVNLFGIFKLFYLHQRIFKLLYLQSAFDNHIEEDKNTDVLEKNTLSNK